MGFLSLFSNLLLFIFILMNSTHTFAMSDEEIDKLFQKGLEESLKGDLSEAISIFESILSKNPSLDRVRLELSRANYYALNYKDARKWAEGVYNNPNTPDGVKQSVVALLSEIKKQSKRHLWSPYISLGWMYDDNVNVGPSTTAVDIGNGTLLLNSSATPRSDSAIQISAGLSHRYLLPRTFSLGKRDTSFLWQSHINLYRNQYFSESDFHLNVISMRTGPAWLASRKWKLQLTAQADDIRIGDRLIAQYGGVTPSFTYFFGSRTALTTSIQVQGREFERDIDNDRDSYYISGGFKIGHQFKFWNTSLLLGWQSFFENAETDRRSNDGIQATLGVNTKPWKNTNMYINFSHKASDYDDIEPIFLTKRDEQENRYVLGGNYKFSKNGIFLNNLVLNAAYTHTKNDSNVEIFEYDRNQLLFSLSKSF